MPPIKRNSRPAAGQPNRRRLAGHGGPAVPEAGAGGQPSGSGRGPVAGSEKPRSVSERRRDARAAGRARVVVGKTKGSPGRESSARASNSSGLGRTFTYTALAVGVVAGVAGGVLAMEPGVEVENRAFVDAETTDEVLTAASTNVQRLVAIDHESLDEYHASLGEFLTPNLVSELEENWPALRDSYEQTATSVDANVTEAGLTHLSEDRAEALLVQDVSMSQDGVAAGSTSGTYLVGLDKVDGVWKLSRIPDLPS